MPNFINFNSVAPFYDQLSKLVFGNKIKSAQINALSFIPGGSNVLIIGGGTGWIIDEISKIHPSKLNITYIESSSKMIQLSMKRFIGFNQIHFKNESVELANLASQYFDVVITPFVLDCFTQRDFENIFQKLFDSLKINGLWIDVDFYLTAKSKFWQKFLIRFMYLFFRITCRINADRLPNTSNCFTSLELVNKKKYCNNFIELKVFKKI